MLDKLRLFKNNDKPTPVVTGKRTSSSSGVSSAKSERSDSSASLEPNLDLKPRNSANNVRAKQQKVSKTVPNSTKSSPGSNKKETPNGVVNKPISKVASEVEKHATKVSSIQVAKTDAKPKVNQAKQVEHPKASLQGPQSGLPTQHAVGTGIPKPTVAVKGTSKPPREEKKLSGLSREGSQTKIALVSPIKSDIQLSESSASTQQSNSSDSSVILKPSSDSGAEQGKKEVSQRQKYRNVEVT